MLARQPGFTVIAVFILALGIGANTAIFSVVDAVLLRPLEFQDPDRLVSVANFWKKTGLRATISAPDYHDWHDQATVFDGLAAYLTGESSVGVDNAADYAVVTRATPEFFNVMGVHAAIGRLPSEEEQKPGGPMTVVVSDSFWRGRLGGDASAIGRTIRYRQSVFTITGVLPRGFRFPEETDIWGPWWISAETASRSAHNYRAVGRLKPGVTLAQAQSEMDGIANRLEATYPASNAAKGVAVDRLLDQMVRSVRTTLQLLLGVVVVVLLIACANVSNLLLARATSRTRELGVRAAVGASRGRLVRQLVTESALLALLAGGAGVLLAGWGIRALVALAPPGIPRIDEVAVDWRVLGFVSLVSIAATFIFGLAPAWQASRVDLNEVLKLGARGSVSARGGGRVRAALVVFETAAAVVLLIGAGLLIRSFASLSRVDLGFRTERLLLMDTTVPAADLDAAKRATRFYTELLTQVSAAPGALSAAGVMGVPTQVRSNGGYWLLGGPGPEQTGVRSAQAIFTVATPKYFATIGVPLVRGRDFSARDQYEAPPVAIINEALARQSFANDDPIGRQIRCGLDRPDYMTIVGVVANVRASDPSRPPTPQLYMPYEQHPYYATALTIVVRTVSDPLALADVLSQKTRALNPDVPVKVSTMDARLSTSVSAPRFRTVLLGTFAGLALVLALAGVYGVMAFTVSQRTCEMGLRMALGAQRSEIVRMTLVSGLRLTSIGVVVGVIAALAATRVLSTMLFDVGEHDPAIFVGVPALLLLVAELASVVPALRAARVDPAIALRAD
jgi:predicted permease